VEGEGVDLIQRQLDFAGAGLGRKKGRGAEKRSGDGDAAHGRQIQGIPRDPMAGA
jgi:hypothetical protein